MQQRSKFILLSAIDFRQLALYAAESLIFLKSFVGFRLEQCWFAFKTRTLGSARFKRASRLIRVADANQLATSQLPDTNSREGLG
jgi:hypothetical protein